VLPAPTPLARADDLPARLLAAGTVRGAPVGLSVHVERGSGATGPAVVGVATETGCWAVAAPVADDAVRALAVVEDRLRPRWVWWSAGATAGPLVGRGLRVATCWDVAAVHRLLAGGAADDAARVWAFLSGLDPATVPRTGQLDLLARAAPEPATEAPDPDDVLEPGGHLRADWADGGWARDSGRAARWARAALTARGLQLERLAATPDAELRRATAHAESAAALLCVELSATGLPVDVPRA
jgi:DNA polymerase-1